MRSTTSDHVCYLIPPAASVGPTEANVPLFLKLNVELMELLVFDFHVTRV
jgi:hypothetical protein